MQKFQRLVFMALVMTYMVILAGAVVRGTGSGLGCPDWPRCFGQWVPPVDVAELPENYKEIYKIAGKTIADFDAFKTWTEYINRLLGALLGLMVVYLFAQSFRYREKDPDLPWRCAPLLGLIIVQGLIGALVVVSHLRPFIITIHMLLAIALLYGLHYLHRYCYDLNNFGISFTVDKLNINWTKGLIALTVAQVLMGTQVRETVDHLIRDTQSATAATVIDQLGWMFYLHRSFSILLLLITSYIVIRLYKTDITGSGFKRGCLILILMLVNMASGIGLNYFGFPAQLQPPHLFVAVILLGVLFKHYLTQRGNLLS